MSKQNSSLHPLAPVESELLAAKMVFQSRRQTEDELVCCQSL